MRYFATLLVLVAVSPAQTAPDAAPAPSPPAADHSVADANAQKARGLLNQAIQALGGAAYLSIQDMQQQGRAYSFYHGESRGGGAPFWRFWKWPDKERVELTKQRDVIYIHTGDKGYEVTFKGTRPEDAKDLAEYLQQREYSLENILRRWVNDAGVALFYDGRTVAADKLADQVTLLSPKNQVVSLFLHTESHLPLKKTYTLRDPETREHDQEAEIYDNYHVVQGIATPYSIVRLHNGEMSRQRFVNSVSYNSGLADSLFDASVTYDPKAKKPVPAQP